MCSVIRCGAASRWRSPEVISEIRESCSGLHALAKARKNRRTASGVGVAVTTNDTVVGLKCIGSKSDVKVDSEVVCSVNELTDANAGGAKKGLNLSSCKSTRSLSDRSAKKGR